MRTIKFIFAATLVVGAFTFTGCSEKEGCTDVNATNYDSDADKDDGSCVYRGNVTFWNYEGDGIATTTVTINNESKQITTDVTSISGPNSCTSCSGCANFTLTPGTYTYEASTLGYTWSGVVTITANGCLKYRLTI